MDTPTPLASIRSYHAHIYFEGAEEHRRAEMLREWIGRRFPVRLGRWHERPVGPHALPMYQVAFAVEVFPLLVPWLMLNRLGLTVLIHPNTGNARRDHLTQALWLGKILEILHPLSLPEADDGSLTLELEPNTFPDSLA